ncbi:MAG: alpha-L-arabinofuranosidase [Lachnospiraceae bacterium]|nr:alpha-L-arabinofuranosidase [Lachnospiraceae bacterium]
MSKHAKITVDPAYKVGKIEKRIYGSFLEPIGDFVVGGIYNPNHPSADEQGFRQDVLQAIREFGVPAIRLPGGNFISGWDWKHSIGPRENRTAQLDLAWKQYEKNLVGHDEYLQWAEKSGAEALYTLNLGTGTVESALHCAEYTNHPCGTYWSDLRKKNGRKDPYNVKVWYLGNEMDGPWQIHSYEKDPQGYGIKAYETAKLLKYMDPSIETAVCGSSSPALSHYPEWERKALEECYPLMDYLSIHYYHWAPEGDYASFFNGAELFENFLNTEIAVCDYVQAKYRHRKKMMISFDEYGINFSRQQELKHGHQGHIPLTAYGEFTERRRQMPFREIDPNKESDFKMPPMRYQMMDALGLTSILFILMRHADRVKIGCMTGGIHGAISFDRNHVWKGASYYPFFQLRNYGCGESILPAVETPVFSAKGFDLDNFHAADDAENIPYVDAAASYDEEKSEAAVFIINRNWEEDMDVEVDLRGFEGYRLLEHQEMFCYDDDAQNTWEKQEILPSVNPDTKLDGGIVRFRAKKLSYNMLRLKK